MAPKFESLAHRLLGPFESCPLAGFLTYWRQAAARQHAKRHRFSAREFSRLEEAVVPGLRVKDLLTPHFLLNRLRSPVNEQRLEGVVRGMGFSGTMAWRSLFQSMGYEIERLPQRGYLLRYNNAPVVGSSPSS